MKKWKRRAKHNEHMVQSLTRLCDRLKKEKHILITEPESEKASLIRVEYKLFYEIEASIKYGEGNNQLPKYILTPNQAKEIHKWLIDKLHESSIDNVNTLNDLAFDFHEEFIKVDRGY